MVIKVPKKNEKRLERRKNDNWSVLATTSHLKLVQLHLTLHKVYTTNRTPFVQVSYSLMKICSNKCNTNDLSKNMK